MRRKIPGFPGYKASDKGNIYSKGRWSTDWKRMRPRKHRGGYCFVLLYKDGKAYNKYVHRLILETFVGPCPNGMQCRHFPDGDKRNNRLDNLQWGSRGANEEDKKTHGTSNQGERHGMCKLTEKDVLKVVRLHEKRGRTISQIARKIGTSSGTVHSILTGKNWSYLTKIGGK